MIEDLGAEDAQARVQDGWTYVDVRTPQEFDGGHPAGSINVPYALLGEMGMMPNPAFTQVMQQLFSPDTRLVMGCAAGGRSMRACQMLEQLGYEHLVNVAGGYGGQRDAMGRVVVKGWADSGLPVETDVGDRSYAAVMAKLRG